MARTREATTGREHNSTQFVAVEIGFWNWPQTLMLARLLNEDPMVAGARILKLREYVLTVGDYGGGLKASADEIAMVCGWYKAARVLLGALQKVRIITGRRLQWQYVDWVRTRTGYYQQRRAADAKWHAEERQRQRQDKTAATTAAAPQATPPGENQGVPSADVGRRRIDSGIDKKKERTSADAGPPGPPEGESERLAAWEWFQKTYPTPRNPKRTRELFWQLTPEDIERIRVHVPRVVLKKPPRFRPGSDKYLREATFLEIRDPKEAKTPRKPVPVDPDRGEDGHAKEVHRAMMARAVELKRQLKAQGLTGAALEEAVDTRLQAELKKGAFGVVTPPEGPHA